jgi:hypothetical protein
MDMDDILALDTPALLNAFTNAGSGSFFDAVPGASAGSGVGAGTGTGMGTGTGTGMEQANRASSSVQGLFSPGNTHNTSNMGSVPGPPPSTRSSYPGAFMTEDLSASARQAQAQAQGQGHFPGQDLVDKFPSWKRNPETDGLPLVGGWFDAADLPRVARDHL